MSRRKISENEKAIPGAAYKSFCFKALIVGYGTFGVSLLTYACMPMLTRMYSPEDYSGYAIFSGVSAIICAVAAMRYELAIVLPEFEDTAIKLLVFAVVASIIMGLLTLGLVMLGPLFCFQDFGLANIGGLQYYLPLVVTVSGIMQCTGYWFVRNGEFKCYSLAQALQTICTLGIQLLLPLTGQRTSLSLVYGYVFGICAACIYLLILMYIKYPQLRKSSFSLREVLATARQYKCYPLHMTPYTLAGSLRGNLASLILAGAGSLVGTSYFNLSSRLGNLPNTLFSSMLRPVYFQYATTRSQAELRTIVQRTLTLMGIVCIPLWALFALNSSYFMALLFGDKWAPAGSYALILSLTGLGMAFVGWLDRTFDVKGRQALAAWLEYAYCACSMLALLAGVSLFDDFRYALAAQSMLALIYICLRLQIIYSLLGFAKGEAQLVCLRGLALAAGSLAAQGMLLKFVPLPLAALLVLALSAGSAAACAGLIKMPLASDSSLIKSKSVGSAPPSALHR